MYESNRTLLDSQVSCQGKVVGEQYLASQISALELQLMQTVQISHLDLIQTSSAVRRQGSPCQRGTRERI